MVEVIRRIERIAGTSIGNLGEPLAPFANSLREQTLPVPDSNWVWGARKGIYKGRKILYSLQRARKALNLTSATKDELYRCIAEEGLSVREFGNGHYYRRYRSEGFLKEVGRVLNSTSSDVSRAVKDMRVEVVYGTINFDPNLVKKFIEITEEYFRGNIDGISPSQRGAGAIRLRANWDGASPTSFYKAMYEAMGQATGSIGSFTPYELDFMHWFYTNRLTTKAGPTEFDKKVIELRGIKDAIGFESPIYEATGIPINREDLKIHRNALIYGQLRSDFF